MICVFVYRDGKGMWGGPDTLPAPGEAFETLWIDLEQPTEEEERVVFERYFKVHPLTLEDITRLRREPDQPPHFPKVEEFSDYLFVIVNPLLPFFTDKLLGGQDHESLNSQLSAVLTERMLITHHEEELTSVKGLHAFLQKHITQASRGPDYLFHLVLDDMVDQYAPLLDNVDGALDSLEEEVFRRPRRNLLARLLALKRSIIVLRKTMVYEREVLARLSRGEFDLIDERETVYYRNVYDHLIRFTELIEASREMVMDLMQTLLAAQANKLNEIMKVLAMISTTVMPMTLIAGIYGMNFEKSFWPHNEAPWAFGFALGLMALCGAGAFGLFRWLKWI